MPDIANLLQQGAVNLWIFIPTAIILGALHGLEPGHSKTMMAAFIIAVRGTVLQAVLLGLAATISHTAIVWIIALGGLYFGNKLNAENTEPYFQLVSAVLIIGLALWMIFRTWKHQQSYKKHCHDHEHGHHHDHLEEEIPGYQDAHQMAHARDIEKRFANRQVTTGQIIIFGLTGGLLPCPAAITVLLLCLQLKKIALGALLVLCFSIGLALVMVAFGVFAALSVKHISKRSSILGKIADRAPYLSGTLIILIGLYVGYHGLVKII